MDKPKQGLEEAVDRVLNNPAFEMLGGYYMVLRRVVIPILLILIFMSVYRFLLGDIYSSLTFIKRPLLSGI